MVSDALPPNAPADDRNAGGMPVHLEVDRCDGRPPDLAARNHAIGGERRKDDDYGRDFHGLE